MQNISNQIQPQSQPARLKIETNGLGQFLESLIRLFKKWMPITMAFIALGCWTVVTMANQTLFHSELLAASIIIFSILLIKLVDMINSK